MNIHTLTARRGTAPIRREVLHNRPHVVFPVVLLVEGVHNGSGGPSFYSLDEISRHPGAWDGRPVPVQHPTVGDMPVSCNSPEIMEEWPVVGQLFNTRFDGGKLKSEVWMDVQTAQEQAPEVLEMVEQGRPLEISTGLWSDDEFQSGVWNGESYNAVVHNIRPDHLALLPGSVGACSWQDGCGGPRVNHKEKEPRMADSGKENQGMLLRALSKLLSPFGFTDNEQSHQEIGRKLQNLVDTWDGQGKVHYVRAVYNDHFIYEVRSESPTVQTGLFKLSYSMNEDTGEVAINGDAQRVREEREFVPITASEEKETKANEAKDNNPQPRNNQEETNMSAPNPKVQELVKGLVANKATQFTEADTEWLSALSECQLSKLTPTVNEESADDPKINAETPELDKALAKGQPTINDDQIAIKKNAISITPEQLEMLINKGFDARVEADQKLVYIRALESANVGLKSADMESMPLSALEALHKTLIPTPDYSGVGMPAPMQANLNSNAGAPAMPGLLLTNEEEPTEKKQ